jgi:uncharacterized membrane protein
MAVDIGKIIHEIVVERGFKAKIVAKAVHMSEATLYKVYKRKIIDIPKLVAFSIFLEKNLFEYYIDDEAINTIFNSSSRNLSKENEALKDRLESKQKRIKELEEMVSTQKKLLNLLEAKVGNRKK